MTPPSNLQAAPLAAPVPAPLQSARYIGQPIPTPTWSD